MIIAWAGENPLDIYRTVISEALFQRSGWRDTLIRATPLVLIGVGLGLGFKANVWNIGAEGQMIVGGLCSIAVIGYVNDLPGAVLIPLGLLLGALGGGLWGALAGWVHVRYGVNIVIATLLLVFIAEPLATWAVRDPLKDPETYLPQSRVVGNAALPRARVDRRPHRRAPWCSSSFLWPPGSMSSTRLGFLIRAHGGNETAATTNEVRAGRLPLLLLALGGALAGIAGFVQLAGVQTRFATGSAAGFGFTAIIVAIVGRNQSGRRAAPRRSGCRRCSSVPRRRNGERTTGQPDGHDPGVGRGVRRRRRRCRGPPAHAARTHRTVGAAGGGARRDGVIGLLAQSDVVTLAFWSASWRLASVWPCRSARRRSER